MIYAHSNLLLHHSIAIDDDSSSTAESKPALPESRDEV